MNYIMTEEFIKPIGYIHARGFLLHKPLMLKDFVCKLI